jgi:hypothetical protein
VGTSAERMRAAIGRVTSNLSRNCLKRTPSTSPYQGPEVPHVCRCAVYKSHHESVQESIRTNVLMLKDRQSMNQQLISFLKAAIECSVYVAPLEPGLTHEELIEVGERAGYQQGEIGDALPRMATRSFGKRLLPDASTAASWIFLSREEPDYRNFQAFDFVVAELNALARAEGAARALLQRSVMVERAVAKGIPRHDVEVAITYQVMANMLTEKDGILRFPNNHGPRGLPSEQLNTGLPRGLPRPDRARAFPIVKDVIERRTDGRPAYAEALDAFAEELNKLGYGRFRLWWTRTVTELRQTEANVAPISASVLAAALVEGALTFVVKHARTTGLGVFQSKDFDRDPRTWKIDDLVSSAAAGGATAILDLQTKNRAETLIRARQRIHAGRMLSEFPGGPPDIRPEEARDAKAIADQVVRAVVDWLQRFPHASSGA